ncbi:uncharacterized protein G2W53_016255 [Senna tora]|uniref:Uncharacterized protein n=1 Tax=Senna tora TaxID=362788 RepID=A0A834TQG5_9FABA|nr:uncharacterized protein G2W53_016255 [Senna tora]
MEQQMAPQSQQFDVPRMPQGGSRRGTRGYHAVRDPILPAEGFYMGSMPQQHGFQGDASNVGGNFGASSSSVPMAGGFGVSSNQFPSGPSTYSPVPPSRTFGEESSFPYSAQQQMPPNIGDFNMYAEILSSSGYATPIQSHVNLNESPPITDDEGQRSQHDPEPEEVQSRCVGSRRHDVHTVAAKVGCDYEEIKVVGEENQEEENEEHEPPASSALTPSPPLPPTQGSHGI